MIIVVMPKYRRIRTAIGQRKVMNGRTSRNWRMSSGSPSSCRRIISESCSAGPGLRELFHLCTTYWQMIRYALSGYIDLPSKQEHSMLSHTEVSHGGLGIGQISPLESDTLLMYRNI